VNVLLNRGAEIEKKTDRNGTPLMAAAGQDDLRMIEMLLNRGANVNATDDDGDPPFPSLSCGEPRPQQYDYSSQLAQT
jgi:ankyrin repeat protein